MLCSCKTSAYFVRKKLHTYLSFSLSHSSFCIAQIAGFANASLEARLNLSLAIAERLTSLEINTTDSGNVQKLVETVTNLLKKIIQ